MTWTTLPPVVMERAICDACGWLMRAERAIVADVIAAHELECGQL